MKRFLAFILLILVLSVPVSAAVVAYATRVANLAAPALYWRFNETTSTMSDSSGNGRTGTVSGSVTRGVTGLLRDDSDLAATFGGGTVTSGGVFSSTTGYTVSFYASFSAFSTDDILNIGSCCGTNPYFRARYITSGSKIRLSVGTNSTVLEYEMPGASVVNNRYHVVAVVDYSAKTVTGYLNGKRIGSQTTANTINALSNRTVTVGSSLLTATIDEVVLWADTVLTDAQIKLLYKSARAIDDAQTEWYAATTGVYDNKGTTGDTLELQSVLSGGFASAGETIWIKAGDYTGQYQIDLQGASGNPIYIKNVRGEHVRILTPALPTLPTLYTSSATQFVEIDGDGKSYAGGVKSIEIANLNTDRVATTAGSNPPNTEVGGRSFSNGTLFNVGTDITMKNVIIHDTSNGVGGFDAARNILAYGLLTYNIGWAGPTASNDRGHGHGIYVSNDNTSQSSFKKIINCISFNNFANSFKTDSVSAAADNMTIQDSIGFNAGYPMVNYVIDTLGASRDDGSISATSTTFTGTGFVSGDAGKFIRIAGAGYAGRDLLTFIKTFTNSTTVVLGKAAQTTVSAANYKYTSYSGGTWAQNILYGSGGFQRVNNDAVVENTSLYFPNWGTNTINAWLGYTTQYNNNISVTGLRAMGGAQGIQLNRWRDVTFSNNKSLNYQVTNISAQYAIEVQAEPVSTISGSQTYPLGGLVRPSTGTGWIYKTTVAGTASGVPTFPETSGATVTTGTVTFTAPTAFQASHAYSRNDLVIASAFDGNTYRVQQAGTSAGSEPTWTTTKNGLTTSGGVIFQTITDTANHANDGTELKPFNADYPFGTNNYFVAGNPASSFRISGYTNGVSTLPLSFAEYAAAGFEGGSSTVTTTAPTTNEIRYHWQDPADGGLLGRGIIAVYNWELLTSITIDLTGSGLVQGQAFEIRDAEDYLNTILASGTYGTGGTNVTSIAVATTGAQVTAPLGWTYDFQTTKPEFVALVVLPGAASGAAPSAPSGFTATRFSSTQVDLTWTDNSADETGFIIERSTDQSSWVSVTTTAANATSYSNTSLASATSFYYRIRATNGSGDSTNVLSGIVTTTVINSWR